MASDIYEEDKNFAAQLPKETKEEYPDVVELDTAETTENQEAVKEVGKAGEAEAELSAEEIEAAELLEEEHSETQEEEGESATPKKGGRNLSKKMAKLVKARSEAEQRAAYLEGLLAAQQANTNPYQEQTQTTEYIDPDAPQPHLYAYGEQDPRFIKDTIRYEILKEDKEKEFQSAISTAFVKYPDLKQTLQSNTYKANDTLTRMIKESDNPSELFAYLAKNPKENDRIAGLSPVQVVKEVTKIELKLENNQDEHETEVRTTKATTPIKPLPGSRATVVNAKKSPYLSY